MNKSCLLDAICACLIVCFSASTTAMEDVAYIANNSNHDMLADNTASGDNQIKRSNIVGIDNSVFVIGAGVIGFFLLRKANNG